MQVKEILQNTARSDNFTGTTPNTKWGYGKVDAFAAVSEVINATSIEKIKNEFPNEFVLSQNYPNPFNPTTTISYQIPDQLWSRKPSVTLSGVEESFVQLKIYDVLGNEIATLVNESQAAGNYSIQFEGSNLSSGIYYYQLKTDQFMETKKMLLIK